MWVNLSDTFVVILISTLNSNKWENEVITPKKIIDLITEGLY